MTQPLKTNTTSTRGVRVVVLEGDLDGGSAGLAQSAVSGAVQSSNNVVVDLSGVHYMSSAGLRVMLLLYREAQCCGARVAVVGLSDELKLLMRATGFLGFFHVAESTDAGIALLCSEAAW
jgi:anti-sigma B factor antagonist